MATESGGKTPWSRLQELCVQNGLQTPRCDIILVEGTKEPLFQCTVTYPMEEIGFGGSKMAAKHQAAAIILENPCRLKPNDAVPPSAASRLQKTPAAKAPTESPVPRVALETAKNDLQMFCQKRRWTLPEYVEVASEPQFVAECRVGNIVGHGEGKRRKDAEKMAAAHVLGQLEALPPEKIEALTGRLTTLNLSNRPTTKEEVNRSPSLSPSPEVSVVWDSNQVSSPPKKKTALNVEPKAAGYSLLDSAFKAAVNYALGTLSPPSGSNHSPASSSGSSGSPSGSSVSPLSSGSSATPPSSSAAPPCPGRKFKGKPEAERWREQSKGVASALSKGSIGVGVRLYLYQLKMTASSALAPDIAFGLLVPNPLPPLNPFSLFPRPGEVGVSVVPLSDFSGKVSKRDLEILIRFHDLVFRDVLQLVVEPVMTLDVSQTRNKCLVAPLVVDPETGIARIHWSFLERILVQMNEFKRTPIVFKSDEERKNWVFDAFQYEDSVVARWYRNDSKSQLDFYFVTRVRRDQTPFSDFPGGKFKNHVEFYTKNYRLQIQNLRQNLLEVETVIARPYMNVLVQAQRDTPFSTSFLVPELCVVHPFPASLWRQGLCLPAALHRINGLLLADEIRLGLTSKLGLLPAPSAWPPMSKTDVPPPKSPGARLPSVRFEEALDLGAHPGPSPGLVLQALTTSGARDAVNLERLETLGDSVLKLAVVGRLFLRNPGVDEGELNVLKGKLVSNSTLLDIGREKLDLHLRVQAEYFVPYDRDKKQNNWLAPLYTMAPPVDALESVQLANRMERQRVYDSNVSDSLEALIGAYLLSCGLKGCLLFMQSLEMETLTEEDLRCPFKVGKVSGFWSADEMEEVEELIRYKFKNRGFLAEALTHPSVQKEGNYQRLEFLGDAVLDYVVTRLLYEDSRCPSPKELTDVRSILVNNTIYACYAAKKGLHRFLKCNSGSLTEDIERFVGHRNRLGHPISAEYIWFEGTSLDGAFAVEEGVSVPKALGDIVEALAGAIYLDSSFSLQTVVDAMKEMFMDHADLFLHDIPVHPVRKLYETKRGVNFVDEVLQENGVFYEVTAVVSGKKFLGVGRSIKVARWEVSLKREKAVVCPPPSGGGAGPPKTPVSLLQELCVRRHLTPVYDLVQVEGSVHEPSFQYRVTVGELQEYGQGPSKKKAKHAAAKAILDKLWKDQPPEIKNLLEQKLMEGTNASYDDGVAGNPVGRLQEFCMGRRWTPPLYEVRSEEGLPHERMFLIECRVNNFVETGAGKSKKVAKRVAAAKLLEKLKGMAPEEIKKMNLMDDEDEFYSHVYSRLEADLCADRLQGIHLGGREGAIRVSQFHNSLRGCSGNKIRHLQETNLSLSNVDFEQLLQEVAEEQNFDVTYVPIEEVSLTGKRQCLVQLCTTPVAVCFGSGSSMDDARKGAALNALHYLRALTAPLRRPSAGAPTPAAGGAPVQHRNGAPM
ncbi:unnamed protein product [Cyprideis torosa]|uniref:Uncharacterized protein n=1 Tax=Cyprideis torosa TaxID=163714 RepID=A0A7R8W811_9CRUS|nr:unnamed protein product [Cyprideis torosa]CAG0888115.1 unnamed protein product [Cyprideis torosa]